MPIPAIIPFKPINPKTRLSRILSLHEREGLARTMLMDVIRAVRGAGCHPRVLLTAPFSCEGVETSVCEENLSEAMSSEAARQAGPLLVIMADLPLVNSAAIKRLIETKQDIALAPGRGGGTNAVFLKDPSQFRFDYYGASFLKHLAIAEELSLSCEVADSFRLHTDIDEEDDLVELLLHCTGDSAMYLQKMGFKIRIDRGRVGIQRSS